jgi:hypothetical protein
MILKHSNNPSVFGHKDKIIFIAWVIIKIADIPK